MMRQWTFLSLLLVLLLTACSGGGDATAENPRVREGRDLYDRADFERAQKHFQSLLAEAEQGGDVLLQAQAQKWLGNIFLAYDQPGEALDWYMRSLEVLDAAIAGADSLGRKPGRELLDERQNVLSNTAVVYKSAKRFDAAEEQFREVLAYDRERGEVFRIAVSLYNLGDVYNQHAVALQREGKQTEFTRKRESARQLFHESLALAPTADAWLNLGNNYAFGNELDSAIIAYRRAEEIYRRDGFRVHRALALGNIGVLALKLERREEAADALRESIEIIEELRGNISSIDIRSSFISDKFFIYENLISILVDLGNVEEAFLYVERAKARSFLDMIGNKAIGEGKQRTPEVQALVDREQQLQQRISALLTQPDSAATLSDAIEAHQRVIAQLREQDPEYASVKSIEPVAPYDLQAMLDDSTAMIEYFVGERSSFVFVVRRDTMLVRRLSLEKGVSLDRAVEALRRKLYYDYPMQKIAVLRDQRLGNGATAEEALRTWYETKTDRSWQFDLVTMYSRLIAPIAPALDGVTQLYIVPHGPLHHLPFQALVLPTGVDMRPDAHVARPSYFIEKYAVSYLPSASVLGFALARDVSEVRSAMIIGDPLYADPKYRRRPLAGALVEADTVAHYASNPLLLKREAAEELVVKREIGDKDLLHFATHGELNKKDPLQSRILLAAADPDSINDGNLTVAKIFNLDLNAMLVTLSACQTAQLSGEEGGFTPGDDLVGLTRSFMYAGTPAVIASLWFVDDAATLAWMRSFYRAWLQGGVGRMQAARQAALRMLDAPEDADWVFPYYWSAFIYMGDHR
jgi:CHAT domain-containing protein